MGFIKEQFKIEDENLLHFLEKTFCISQKEAKKMVNKGRVALNGERIKHYNKSYNGILDVIYFKPEPIGIKPIFEIEDFAIFDKPSGVAIHPKGFNHSQTLLDDVRFLYGKDANLAHRLDKETSGLVIASKNKWSDKILKKMFEDKEIQKYYLALVEGKITHQLTINKPIIVNKDLDIKMKVLIDKEGKESKTIIKPLKIMENKTLVMAIPLTGRQHQIRVHLYSIGHRIIGDPLYGVDSEIADKYLKRKLSDEDRIKFTGANRLMLHAYRINFSYNNRIYDIFSRKWMDYKC
jgi:23S rRNA pseudouridine1911/1915/1917 synthase